MKKKTASKWVLVAGARPNFVKIAPLMRAIPVYHSGRTGRIKPFLVHTGQHYDENMSEAFFKDLGIPGPDIHLGVGSGSHAGQTGRIMIAFEETLLRERPDFVVVVGDVNSTMACALAAVKLQIPVAHVEAGLRSFDRTMPEEINRIVTDAVSDFLFTPSVDGDRNLLQEGIAKEKIFLVGNIMVDSLLFSIRKAKGTGILKRLGLVQDTDSLPKLEKTGTPEVQKRIRPYALLTLHRSANVDDPVRFGRILKGLGRAATLIPILFPLHPRTRKQILAFGLEEAFVFHESPRPSVRNNPTFCGEWNPDFSPESGPNIHCLESLPYLDFLNLMAHAQVVLTDSGGVQEETTALNIPCITIRDTTERPVTLTHGTNVLVGDDPAKIFSEIKRALVGSFRKSRCPAVWDGHTAERIVRILAERSGLFS